MPLFSARKVLIALGASIVVTAPNEILAQDIFAGRPVYEAHCASCHGLDGRAAVAGTPDFFDGSGLFASDAELITLVRDGRNLMPGYDLVLTETEILNVIAYVRTLQR